MTEQLKALALAAKEKDSDWFMADALESERGLAEADAAYIAAASPDVVLALINDLEKHRALLLTHLAVIDPMREQAKADEALMREALEMCEAVLCNYVCRGTHEETVKHNAAIDAVRARLGTTNATEAKHI